MGNRDKSDNIEAFYYQLYGLTLRSNIPLPGLISTPKNTLLNVEVKITGDTQTLLLQKALTANYDFGCQTKTKADGNYIHLWYRSDYGRLDFEINSTGSKIYVNWQNSRLKEATALLLGGGVLGCAMRLQGMLCLHANVVAIGKYAIAIVGEKGAGKSTTTAALAKRGYPILSDDIAALKQEGDTFFAQPGYPRLRLWLPTIHALYGSEEGLEKIFHALDKRYINLTTDINASAWKFQSEPLPLAAIYILEPRRQDLVATNIEPVSVVAALMNLMNHRSAKFLKLDNENVAREWKNLSHLLASVPVRRVQRPDDLNKLPELCDVIVNDAQSRLLIHA